MTIGHDVPAAQWEEAVKTALKSFPEAPYILQHFDKPKSQTVEVLDSQNWRVSTFSGRTRLCPYYFVSPPPADSDAEPTISLAGVLATSCPADKKVIHGMKDAVLAPSCIV